MVSSCLYLTCSSCEQVTLTLRPMSDRTLVHRAYVIITMVIIHSHGQLDIRKNNHDDEQFKYCLESESNFHWYSSDEEVCLPIIEKSTFHRRESM